jgi:hypothetical protein
MLERSHASPQTVTPEEAAAWFAAHTALTTRDTAHLGDGLGHAVHCLVALSANDEAGDSWFAQWADDDEPVARISPQCSTAAERWVSLASDGAMVTKEQVGAEAAARGRDVQNPRDAFFVDVSVAHWGLQGVTLPPSHPSPERGGERGPHDGGHMWRDDDHRYEHDDNEDDAGLLLFLLVALPFAAVCCLRRARRRRAARAAAMQGAVPLAAAHAVPPPPSRFVASQPTPQYMQASAAAASAAAPGVHYPLAQPPPATAAAPGVHYPLAQPPPATAAAPGVHYPLAPRSAPNGVPAGMYPDVEDSSWSVSSWFGGQPSAPSYSAVSAHER